MPPLAPVPNVVRAKIGYTLGDDTGAGSRLFFKYTGGAPTAADLTTWASTIFDALTPLAAFCTVDKVFTSVVVQDLGTDIGFQGAHVGATPGTRAILDNPASAAVVFEHVVARHYRGGKPKAYMPLGAPVDLNTAQTWGAALVTEWSAAWTTFLLACTEGSPAGLHPVDHVNVSYYQGSTASIVGGAGYERGKTTLKPRVGGPHVDLVISSAARIRVGTQRRRVAA